MILNLKLTSSNGQSNSDVSIMVDFKDKVWRFFKGDKGVWQKIAFSDKGRIEVKDWGVVWLFDELGENRIIFHGAPSNSLEVFKPAGSARLYKPMDSSFQDSALQWNVDLQEMNAQKNVGNQPSSAIRQRLLEDLNKVLPCSYMDNNYKKITGGLTKQGGGYTTCGSLPGYVSAKLWEFKTGKMASLDILKRITLNGTNNVRTKGMKYGAWFEANLTDRPKPGDVYALLDYNKTNKKDDVIGHVGVIQSSSGDEWTTADLGQGDGYSGKRDIKRPYKSVTGELYGESNQGGGYRILAGWVDLDKYYAAI
ncbi:MAG TPA: hypothetical protein VK892_14220 [Pyrinomonadaceae bacterium]|nr:hypothetical protein [Pyrinomonadaceae bacterium]